MRELRLFSDMVSENNFNGVSSPNDIPVPALDSILRLNIAA
jgi:hypothetical protein